MLKRPANANLPAIEILGLGSVKVWHAVVMLLAIMAFVRPGYPKRMMVFLLIFFTITGCGRDSRVVIGGAKDGLREPLNVVGKRG